MDNEEQDIHNELFEIEMIDKSSAPDVARLLELARNEDSCVRWSSFEVLINYQLPEVKQQVLEGLKDSHELVRVACLEILGDWKEEDCIDDIRLLLADDYELVQSYAALALADIGNRIAVPWIAALVPESVGEEGYFFLCGALYRLGEENYLSQLITGLSDPWYRSRCASAHLLAECVNDFNGALILEHLTAALKVEHTVAARSSIEAAISEITFDEQR